MIRATRLGLARSPSALSCAVTRRDPAVAVARKLGADRLDARHQASLRHHGLGRPGLRPVVVGARGQAHDPAPGSDAAGLGPLTTEELAPLARRAEISPLLSRSSSLVSWPTLRSRPAIFAS